MNNSTLTNQQINEKIQSINAEINLLRSNQDKILTEENETRKTLADLQQQKNKIGMQYSQLEKKLRANQEPTLNSITRLINRNLENKTKKNKLSVLGTYAPKSKLFGFRSTRIKEGRNKLIKAHLNEAKKNYNSRKANRNSIQKQLDDLQMQWNKVSNLIQQTTNNLISLQEQREQLTRYYTHPISRNINSKEKNKQRYLHLKKSRKNEENEMKLKKLIQVFENYGFTFVPFKPEVVQSEYGGLDRSYVKEPAVPAHFLYETSKEVSNSKNLSKYANWKKEQKETLEEIDPQTKAYMNAKWIPKREPQKFLSYVLTREYPSTYPPQYKNKKIEENEWDQAIVTLEALQPY